MILSPLIRLLYLGSMIFIVNLSCVSDRPAHEKRTFYRMDTALEVTLVTNKNQVQLESTWVSVDSLLTFWEQHYSQSTPESELKALNNRKESQIPVSRQLGRMIALALRYGDTTQGSYDISILPLKNLWGLGEKDTIQKIPSDDTLARAVQRVDCHRIHVDSSLLSVYFDSSNTEIDAGGFAKGFALIETSLLLDRLGYQNYLIAAGDVIGRGRRADGTAWNIGIQHPRKPGTLLGTVRLDSGVVFTSGDYERYWITQDGKRVHHIFNPKTGRSCTGNQSVTIWSMEPLQAKFLSTGLFCWPADSILAFVSRRPLECVVVDSSGAVLISNGWKDKVRLTE
jgi:FAD:protein FMN transferase